MGNVAEVDVGIVSVAVAGGAAGVGEPVVEKPEDAPVDVDAEVAVVVVGERHQRQLDPSPADSGRTGSAAPDDRMA